MLRMIALLLCLILPGLALAEERPRAGLMWNRSGLPVAFPLIVKTMPGKDYVLFVTEPATNEPRMAGYIRGGEFFRLLLPPGEWRLRFAFGKDWQDQERLFGPGTGWTEMDEPLDFRVLGFDRKRAYVVTLIESDGRMKIVDARADAECQLVLWDSQNREWPEDLPGMTREQRERLFGSTQQQIGPQERPSEEPDRIYRPLDDVPLNHRPRLRYLDQSFSLFKHLCS